MAKSNVAEFLVNGDNGKLDVEATVSKFRTALEHYMAAETVDLDTVRALVYAEIKKHTRLSMVKLQTAVFVASKAELSALDSLNEKVSIVVKSDPLLESVKGPGGGIGFKSATEESNPPTEQTEQASEASEAPKARRGRTSQAA